MKIEYKYIKAFSEEKSEQLKEAGFEYLYERGGIFYFKNNKELTVNFSKNDILKDTKLSMWINF